MRLDFVLDEGTPIGMKMFPGLADETQAAIVSVAEKGFANIRLSASSPGGHSSAPPPNGTVISVLARIIDAIERRPYPSIVSTSPGAALLEALAPHIDNWIVRFVLSNAYILDWPWVQQLIFSRAPIVSQLFKTAQAFTLISGASSYF